MASPPLSLFMIRSRACFAAPLSGCGAAALVGALALGLSPLLAAQQATPASTLPQGPSPAANPAPAASPAASAQSDQPFAPPAQQTAPTPLAQPQSPAPVSKAAESSEVGGITEDSLKKMLVGKSLYLRGGYLDGSLSFNEHGVLIGHSPTGSYTLCLVEIDKVHLTKHKVELEGVRYGLHFLGALPYEDPSKAVDRVRITPKKKELKITIDRESVIKPKKTKDKREREAKAGANQPLRAGSPAPPAAGGAPPQPGAAEADDTDEAKAEIAAAPADQRPADPGSVTTTISPAHATQVLKDALANVLAQGLDARMMAAMPEFWRLYYQSAAARTDFRPRDPGVLRQSNVDRKARLISNFQPESNEYAQAAGVAGMALYHAVIGPDGKPDEIAVARPIGFGLDENAVEAIRKAKFEPAMKNGKPVPVLLDLVVEFRIYSKLTGAESHNPEAEDKPAAPSPPGPYSAEHR